MTSYESSQTRTLEDDSSEGDCSEDDHLLDEELKRPEIVLDMRASQEMAQHTLQQLLDVLDEGGLCYAELAQLVHQPMRSELAQEVERLLSQVTGARQVLLAVLDALVAGQAELPSDADRLLLRLQLWVVDMRTVCIAADRKLHKFYSDQDGDPGADGLRQRRGGHGRSESSASSSEEVEPAADRQRSHRKHKKIRRRPGRHASEQDLAAGAVEPRRPASEQQSEWTLAQQLSLKLEAVRARLAEQRRLEQLRPPAADVGSTASRTNPQPQQQHQQQQQASTGALDTMFGWLLRRRPDTAADPRLQHQQPQQPQQQAADFAVRVAQRQRSLMDGEPAAAATGDCLKPTGEPPGSPQGAMAASLRNGLIGGVVGGLVGGLVAGPIGLTFGLKLSSSVAAAAAAGLGSTASLGVSIAQIKRRQQRRKRLRQQLELYRGGDPQKAAVDGDSSDFETEPRDLLMHRVSGVDTDLEASDQEEDGAATTTLRAPAVASSRAQEAWEAAADVGSAELVREEEDLSPVVRELPANVEMRQFGGGSGATDSDEDDSLQP